MEVAIVWRRIGEGKCGYGKGQAMHFCLVVYCGGRLVRGDERVVVCGKFGRRTGKGMISELGLDLCRAEKGVGNKPATFCEFLDCKMSAPLACSSEKHLITLLSDMTNLIVQPIDSLVLPRLTC